MPDIYEQITDKIIEQLNNGVVPWRSPYFSKTGFPRNFATQKEYRGINVLLLGSQQFTSPYFLTFLQAKELGGSVRKGEHGFLVVKYGTYGSEEDTMETPAKSRGYLKAYTVFNSSQIEGIQFPDLTGVPDKPVTSRTDKAREILDNMPQRPEIQTGSAVPCYRPQTDSVHMPEIKFFTDEESFYATLFHELGHATGHHTRLARKSLMENRGIGASGDTPKKIYAEEELVAEMTASFVGPTRGLRTESRIPLLIFKAGSQRFNRRMHGVGWSERRPMAIRLLTTS